MKTSTRIIAALWFWSVVTYLDRVAISFAGPAIMHSLALSAVSFGIILSSFGVGYLLAQIPGGMLADKYGARIVLVVGPLFWAFFTGLTGFVSTLAAFIVVRICFGLSEGLSIPSLHRVVGDEFEPRDRAKALGIIFTGFAIGPAIAGPFVGILANAYGWQWMFLLMAVPALVASLVSYFLMPALARTLRPGVQKHSDEEGSLKEIFVRPTFWILTTFYFCYNIGFWGYIGWMPNYLSITRHITLAKIGFMAGLPYIFATIGLVAGGWLGTRFLDRYRPQFVGVLLLCAGAALFVAYRADDLVQSMAGLCAAAFFLYGTQGPIGAIILDLSPARFRGTYYGSVSMGGQLGGIVAPAMIGYLVTETGQFASGFGFMVGALCIGALCMVALVAPLSRKRRVREEEISSLHAEVS